MSCDMPLLTLEDACGSDFICGLATASAMVTVAQYVLVQDQSRPCFYDYQSPMGSADSFWSPYIRQLIDYRCLSVRQTF